MARDDQVAEWLVSTVQQLANDLCDQKGQVRTIEAQSWSWHAMMLDIGRDVFMVRVSSRQQPIVGVRP
jgi:hypothetical protein